MSEIDHYILNLIKDCWPQFDISKEDLLHPTVQLVVRFYNNFINDANHKIAYLSGSADIINKIDVALEEQLFEEVSRLLKKIIKLKFTLGDISQPTPIRTKNFFKACIHFIAFMNQSLNEIDALGSDIFKKKEEINELLVQQEELLHEMNENAKVKVEMFEFNKILHKSSDKSYKKMMARRTANEKLFTEKRHQIENLTCSVRNRECEFNYLETIKEDLLKKKVTKSEYKNILHTPETLKSESGTLGRNDVIIGDVFMNVNQVLQHCDDWIRELNKCCESNVHQNVKNLIKLEQLKIASNTCEKLWMNKLNLLIQKKLESEKNLAATKEYLSNLKSKYKEMVEHRENTLKQFTKDVEMARKRLEGDSQNNLQIISNYNKTIKKLEEYMNKLPKTVALEYYKASEVEKKIVNKFNTLERYRNLL